MAPRATWPVAAGRPRRRDNVHLAGVAMVALVLAGLGSRSLWSTSASRTQAMLLAFLVLGAGFSGCGLLITSRLHGHRVGWAATTAGLLLLLAAALHTVPGGASGSVQVGVAALTVVLPVLVLCYPSGRLDGRLERLLVGPVVVLGAMCPLLVTHPEAWAWALSVLLAVLVALVWWRVERSHDEARRSLLWLVYGVGVTALIGGHALFLADSVESPLGGRVVAVATLLIALSVPTTMTIGVLAPRLVDIRQLISRTVLYVVMVELVVATFAGSLAALALMGAAGDDRAAAAVLAVVIAAAFHPVAVRVRRVLDELLFGGSADPVATMSTLGAQLGSHGDPRNWIDALRTALSLPRIELWQRGQLTASSGHPVAAVATIALAVGDEQVGDLVVGLPEQASSLPRAIRGVLDLVAVPLARSLQAVNLATELRGSREHLVAALEEERRRLRRELHDGLGPLLTGVAYSADAARNLLRHDAVGADELLLALRQDTASAISEIRRIVHGLRPPALDELGLIGAIRQQVGRLHCADGRPMTVHLSGAGLPRLPAAVEVAAYRIVIEAVVNAARHSSSDQARVSIAADDDVLTLTVTDSGVCQVADWSPGVGIVSMRERCAQIGGTLEAGPTAAGGRVEARLPIREFT